MEIVTNSKITAVPGKEGSIMSNNHPYIFCPRCGGRRFNMPDIGFMECLGCSLLFERPEIQELMAKEADKSDLVWLDPRRRLGLLTPVIIRQF